MIGRLLGIDHGLARIGIAVSDPLGVTATELTIIKRRSRAEDFARINEIAAREGVVALVVGVPYSDVPDDVYTQADTVKLWINRLAETTDLPIILWDERQSSDEAGELSKLQGRKPEDHIDDLAARIILQRYLDALHDGLATPPPRP